MGMTPERSKNPKLYKNPTPPLASVDPFNGRAYVQQRLIGTKTAYYRITNKAIDGICTLSAMQLVVILDDIMMNVKKTKNRLWLKINDWLSSGSDT